MPRCRAIMCPGRTTSPFPRFNPKYFALESRPLLDEPPCFFDANRTKTAFTPAFQHFNSSPTALGPAPRLTSARTDDAIARPAPLFDARESMKSRARRHAHTHARARAHNATCDLRPSSVVRRPSSGVRLSRRALPRRATVPTNDERRRGAPRASRIPRSRVPSTSHVKRRPMINHPCVASSPDRDSRITTPLARARSIDRSTSRQRRGRRLNRMEVRPSSPLTRARRTHTHTERHANVRKDTHGQDHHVRSRKLGYDR